jgi:hypothetical protein
VPAKIVRYRGYGFVIHGPDHLRGRWHVVIWAPDNVAPTLLPDQVSEEEAIEEARATVDQMIGAPDSSPATV